MNFLLASRAYEQGEFAIHLVERLGEGIVVGCISDVRRGNW